MLLIFCFLKIHFKQVVPCKWKKDSYISLGDSYIEKEGDEKEVAQFIDDILNGKIKMCKFTNSIPKTPVNLTKRM